MEEFTLETLDDIISDTIELDREVEKSNVDKLVYNNPYAKRLKYLLTTKQLLEEGHKVSKHTQGIIVNNKFIIGASLRKWRANGKGKWYWYSKDSFAKVLGKST